MTLTSTAIDPFCNPSFAIDDTVNEYPPTVTSRRRQGWDGRADGMAAHLLGTHAPRAQHRPPQPRAPRRTTVALESANRIIPPCRTLRLAAFVHGTATSGRLIHWMRFLSLPVTGLPKVSSASIPNHARAAMPPYRHRTSCLPQASCHLGHRLSPAPPPRLVQGVHALLMHARAAFPPGFGGPHPMTRESCAPR